MMLDLFNRKIDYLRISVTDRCNLRCIYCMPKRGVPLLKHQDILRYEEIWAIVNASIDLGINKFRITGGEPLARKGLVEFASELKKIEGIKDLSLTTNGIRLKEFAYPLYQSGIKRINISLDTLNHNKFIRITQEDKLDDVLEGIEEVLHIGFSPIKINVVLIRGINEEEILDFARLTLDRPLNVRFIELMPIREGRLFGQDNTVPVDEVKLKCQLLGDLQLVNDPRGNGPAEYYQIKDAPGRIGFIGAITHPFCLGCNRLRLTANGFLKLCLGHQDKIDLKPALRPNINYHKIKTLIEEAINLKPKEHNLTQENGGDYLHPMVEVGG